MASDPPTSNRRVQNQDVAGSRINNLQMYLTRYQLGLESEIDEQNDLLTTIHLFKVEGDERLASFPHQHNWDIFCELVIQEIKELILIGKIY